MKVLTNNEWDPLKSVVVGSSVFANRPEGCHFEETGPYKNHICAQAAMDLERFANVLKHEGVKVHRPKDYDFVMGGGMYNYCPRDRLLIVGDTVFDCHMQYPCRDIEAKFLSVVTDNARRVVKVPRSEYIMFDAANVLRLNDTLLYLVSPSATAEGAHWLAEQLPNHTVETTETYGGIHIDSTFIPVREGLVVVNKDRVSEDRLPRVFKDWEILWLGKEHLKPKHRVPGTPKPFASNYIQFNFLMINPELAVTDDCPALKEALLTKGVYSYTIPFTHSTTLGGGHHCCSLDLYRRQ